MNLNSASIVPVRDSRTAETMIDPIALFFVFGLLAGLLAIDVGLPPSINELLTFLLLFTIGLKGGIELEGISLMSILPKALAVGALGVVIPIVAYPLIKRVGKLSRADAAAMAAHYGSVSVGTFAVCIAFLQRHEVSFEPYVITFVVVLEIPAILVGLFIARGRSSSMSVGHVLLEVFKSKAIYLLVGGLIIGRLAGHARLEPFMPLFFELFSGVLALFLVEMGLIVSRQMSLVRHHGFFLIGFGVLMPLAGGMTAMGLGFLLDLSLGGTVVLTVLGASASYIAVPAAMRVSLPEANLGLSLGSSLGVTFPFNVVAGIPLFYAIASYFA